MSWGCDLHGGSRFTRFDLGITWWVESIRYNLQAPAKDGAGCTPGCTANRLSESHGRSNPVGSTRARDRLGRSTWKGGRQVRLHHIGRGGRCSARSRSSRCCDQTGDTGPRRRRLLFWSCACARGSRLADVARVRCSGSVVLARRGLGPAMPLAAVATGTSLQIVGGVSWAVLHEPLARL